MLVDNLEAAFCLIFRGDTGFVERSLPVSDVDVITCAAAHDPDNVLRFLGIKVVNAFANERLIE